MKIRLSELKQLIREAIEEEKSSMNKEEAICDNCGSSVFLGNARLRWVRYDDIKGTIPKFFTKCPHCGNELNLTKEEMINLGHEDLVEKLISNSHKAYSRSYR